MIPQPIAERTSTALTRQLVSGVELRPSGATLKLVGSSPPQDPEHWRAATSHPEASTTFAPRLAARHMLPNAGDTRVSEMICAALKSFVERGATPAARALLAVAQRLQPSAGEALEQWVKVLARPGARHATTATGHGTRANYQWLDEHKATHAGKWVALLHGELVDLDDDQRVLHRRLKTAGKLEGVLLTKVPRP